MPPPLTFLIVFLWVLVSALAGMKFLESRRKKQVNELLSTVARRPVTSSGLLKDPAARPRTGVRFQEKIENQIRQAGLEWTPGHLAGLMALAACAGAVLGALLPIGFPAPWRMAALSGVVRARPRPQAAPGPFETPGRL